jgi:hypothetical protein
MRPYLQNNQHKTDWRRCGSSSSVKFWIQTLVPPNKLNKLYEILNVMQVGIFA